MRVAITGASRGIGAALADHYRAAGAEVIGTATAGGDGLVPLDVADPDGFAAFAAAIGDGPLDLLVCNAGIFPERQQDDALGDPAAWARGFAVNVTGIHLTVTAALPALRRAGAGKIAVISSQLGSSERAGGGTYIYRASKAAAANLAMNLAADLRREGIAVAAYHPGHVRTDMGGGAAALSPEDSAAGLAARFDDLAPETGGRFLTWDGRSMPF